MNKTTQCICILLGTLKDLNQLKRRTQLSLLYNARSLNFCLIICIRCYAMQAFDQSSCVRMIDVTKMTVKRTNKLETKDKRYYPWLLSYIISNVFALILAQVVFINPQSKFVAEGGSQTGQGSRAGHTRGLHLRARGVLRPYLTAAGGTEGALRGHN